MSKKWGETRSQRWLDRNLASNLWLISLLGDERTPDEKKDLINEIIRLRQNLDEDGIRALIKEGHEALGFLLVNRWHTLKNRLIQMLKLKLR